MESASLEDYWQWEAYLEDCWEWEAHFLMSIGSERRIS